MFGGQKVRRLAKSSFILIVCILTLAMMCKVRGQVGGENVDFSRLRNARNKDPG